VSNLTPKQELFVAEYLKDLNATQAAIRAGYAESGARTEGARLLANADIAAAVKAAIDARTEQVKIDANYVLRELFKLANVDLSAAYDEFGNLKPIHEIPEDVRKAIAGIEVFEERDHEGTYLGRTRKVKFWDKTRALEMLGRHLALFKDRIEVSVDSKLTDELRAARERAAAIDLI